MCAHMASKILDNFRQSAFTTVKSTTGLELNLNNNIPMPLW